METQYGTNSPSTYNSNFFSEEKPVTDPVGAWSGATACPSGSYSGAALDNSKLNYACFNSFAGSAGAAFGSKYGSIVTSILGSNPNASIVDVFNAAYAAGWDKSKATTAGGTIQGTQGRITSEIDCLKKYGYIQ